MPTQTEMGLGYPGSTERVSSLKRQYLGRETDEEHGGVFVARHAEPPPRATKEDARATHLSPRKKKVCPVGSHQMAVSTPS